MDTNDVIHVNIDNVVRWFFEINSQDVYDIYDDFPSLASPWPMATFHSGYVPKAINVHGELQPVPIAIRQSMAGFEVRVAMTEISIKDVQNGWLGTVMNGYYKYMTGKAGPGESGINYTGDVNDARFLLIISSGYKTAQGLVFSQIVGLYLDRTGVPLNDPIIVGKEHRIDAIVFCVFMAISLLHCKNVALIDKPLSRQQRRLLERKGGIRYKVLDIEPFKQQVRRETQPGESQMQRALHICRGHFATYTDDAPLFGKVTGTFWKPMHVRGNSAAGEVIKDYNVKLE